MNVRRLTTTITTSTAGGATAYLPDDTDNGNGVPHLNGELLSLAWTSTAYATTKDFTVTGEDSGDSIISVSNVTTTAATYRPAFEDTDSSGTTVGTFRGQHIASERIKIVIAQGGSAAAGTWTAYVKE